MHSSIPKLGEFVDNNMFIIIVRIQFTQPYGNYCEEILKVKERT